MSAAPTLDHAPGRSAVRSLAQRAGVLYVVIIVLGLFAEVVVRGTLVEAGDPAATAANIVSSQWLFRAGFAADLVVFLADVALAVVLYRLLRPVSRTLSALAAAFRLTQTAIIGMNLLNMFTALRVLDGADYLQTLGAPSTEALALLALDTHRYGYILGLTFFGAATVTIGYMAITSRGLPSPMGAVLVLAGGGYLIDAAMFFLVPGYDGAASAVVLAPALVGEAWFAGWLLAGARGLQRLDPRAETPVSAGQPRPRPALAS
jgi:hypothetical protein